MGGGEAKKLNERAKGHGNSEQPLNKGKQKTSEPSLGRFDVLGDLEIVENNLESSCGMIETNEGPPSIAAEKNNEAVQCSHKAISREGHSHGPTQLGEDQPSQETIIIVAKAQGKQE